MDKRKSPRYDITLNALVHPNVGRSWLCTIRDYCEFGMLLTEQEGTRSRRGLPGVNPGETVGIHFSVPTGTKDQHFRLEGNIVRVLDTGIGINFPQGMDQQAIDALTEMSGEQPASSAPAPAATETDAAAEADPAAAQTAEAGQPQQTPAAAQQQSKNLSLQKKSPFASGGLQPADAKRIVAALRKGAAKMLPEMTAALFKYMDAELLEAAKDAKSNAEQSEYFAAMSNLEKAKQQVTQDFSKEVLDQFDNPRDLETLREERRKANEERKAASAKRIKLSLINTEEFEDWLAVANIISRSERSYERYLTELLARMGMIVDAWGHKEANPMGLAVFTHAFDESIQKVELSKDIRQKVYTGYESKIIPLFRRLYIASTKLLEETGLFPDLDDDYISATPVKTRDDSEDEARKKEEEEKQRLAEEEAKRQQEAEVEEDEDFDDVDEEEELEELKEELRRRRQERRERVARRRQEVLEGGRAGGGRQSRPAPPRESRPPKDVSSAISSIYNNLRELVEEEDDFQEFEDDYVEIDEVQDLLSTLQARIEGPGERMRVREQIMDNAIRDGRRRRLAPAVQESLEVVENLIDSVEDDSLLSGSAKDWIRSLELTLDKVATRQQDFMSDDNPHTSMQVINQLAALGGSESGSIKRHVDEIVSDITDNYDSNPQVFEQALDKLQPLVDRQSRAFTGNVQRAVKASEGQQTLLNAQRAVVQEMDTRLAGREVPEILMKLLMPGWRNLLVNTHLRQGQGSTEWKNHMRALDQVMSHLEGNETDPASDDYVPPEQLLEEIESGLDSISFEPGQRAPLLSSLRQILTSDAAAGELPMVNLTEQSVAETLGFANVSEKEEKRQEILKDNEGDHNWQRCYDRAQRLHVGEWTEFLYADKEAEIAIVAWVNDDHTSMVFVNRRGVKTHELTIEEIATLLFENGLRILEESDIPLTDRASHRMLQNMHNKLTHQATHDELTGLVNRKEFEREVNRVLALAKKNHSHHIVAFLDLDQFKVINNTSGHDAGDMLLVDLSKMLEQMAPDNMILSRLGGDEFGILLEECEWEAGMGVVQRVCTAIKDHRFKFGEETYALTTSCGVAHVDAQMESVSGIMRAVDQACYMAKDAGRDRVQVYESGDSEMAHRKGIMEFVSTIDQALEDNRFVLNCQAIAPIDEGEDGHMHYEVLLTVLDEDDKPLPPQDFIVAAETYNRMGAIDRWVIANAFDFIASNILRLDHVGHFSINISGNSLTEDDFMEYVLEQFNRTRLPTNMICFEITETSAIGNLDAAIEFMEKMKVIGVEFSLDDFGTGLSSYSYLRNLPVDYLKIDGIFVKDIKSNPSDYAVVKSINEIGHFMGKKTIAEYVEDDEIVQILREIGVDFAQGWGVGKKIPIVELLDE